MLGSASSQRWQDIRSGEIGSAPIILAIALIRVFFYTKNSNFVGATNFNNMIVQMAGVDDDRLRVVFVLLLGEIDLSVGYVSGLAGVTVAEMQLPGSNHQFRGSVAILMRDRGRGRDRRVPGLVRRRFSASRRSSSRWPATSRGRG